MHWSESVCLFLVRSPGRYRALDFNLLLIICPLSALFMPCSWLLALFTALIKLGQRASEPKDDYVLALLSACLNFYDLPRRALSSLLAIAVHC